MKECFRCNQSFPLSEFYAHRQMADGHLNKCKSCTKADTAARLARLMANPVTREQEYQRHRLKSARARIEGRHRKPSPESRRAALARYAERHPEENKARCKVNNEIRAGRLIPQPCEFCGKKAQAHHPDHSKPLEVQWLCSHHHAEADNELRRQRRDAALAS